MQNVFFGKTIAGPQSKANLRRWIGREQYRMDFRLKKLKRGYGGLNMGLGPGPYRGDPMPDDAIHIAEDAFWFLELGIKKHCAQYSRPYAHYGVTEVSREEWSEILREWEGLSVQLEAAKLTPQLEILRVVPKDTRKMFIRDFDRNRRGLSKMIGLLSEWMRAELITGEQISILGI